MIDYDTARDIAHELLDSGHPRAASVMLDLLAKLDRPVTAPEARIARLEAVIRHAMPHQTNAEVARWMSAALAGFEGAIFDNQGRRVDQTP